MAAHSVSEVDRIEVTEVIHRYFWLADHGQAHLIPALFAKDANLEFGAGAPKPGTLTVPEIATAMQARARQTHVTTRHVVSNLILRAKDTASIEAYSLLTLFRSEDSSRDASPRTVADVEDVFILEQGKWLIAHRKISPIFNRA